MKKFTDWVKWEERTSIKGNKYPGVYLLARFNSSPPSRADAVDKNIIYIGETCSNTLLGRWRQFNASAFLGKPGHSGGKTYRKKFADAGKKLYVAAFPVTMEDERLSPLYIRYFERKVIWEYAMKWGDSPICNMK